MARLQKLLVLDTALIDLADHRGGHRSALLVGPTHPLRLLWLATWLTLARNWVNEAVRAPKEFFTPTRDKRIDAERCGQVALAFSFKMPLEAKNRKSLIFGEKYEDIFSESTTAESLLLPLLLFKYIETKSTKPAAPSWLRYASYHLLFGIRIVAEQRGIDLTLSAIERLKGLYSTAKKAVSAARSEGRMREGDDYEDILFFKTGLAKDATTQQILRTRSRNSNLKKRARED